MHHMVSNLALYIHCKLDGLRSWERLARDLGRRVALRRRPRGAQRGDGTILNSSCTYLIASRIPPGLGGSIALGNDNVYCLGPLEGILDASGVPLGGLWGCMGGLREASGRRPGGVFGALGGILGALAAKKLSRYPKDAPKSFSKTPPRGPRWQPKACQKRPQRSPRGFKRP